MLSIIYFLHFPVSVEQTQIHTVPTFNNNAHGRTGLEILRSGHEFARLAPGAPEPLGDPGNAPPQNFQK